jgi:Arc/MetJ-type ribon-helix-helix transcriptional regulator
MTDHAHTLLILTDAESRVVRRALELLAQESRAGLTREKAEAPFQAFNRGITRGTERMAAEFAAAQKAKRK